MPLSPHTRTRLITRNGKKVRAHRWIMEQHLGRSLTPHEHVHHRNGNPLNNRLENLEVLLCIDHMKLHKQIYPDTKICVVCGNPFIVNPRKRARNKTCSSHCAMSMRIAGRKRQSASRKSSRSSGKR
jgi:hypothetical protein